MRNMEMLPMLPEPKWAEFSDEALRVLAGGAAWSLAYEARERREGALWYPTANPAAARRSGHFVVSISTTVLPAVDGTPFACTLRHESDETLCRLLSLVRRLAEKELVLRGCLSRKESADE